METMRKRTVQHGFTLIEILIAIAIIGGLMAVILPPIMTRQRRANEGSAKIQLRQIQASVNDYYQDTDTYPETLKDLVRKPVNEEIASKWSGPYISDEKQLNDPWKQKFQYQVTPDQEHPYELFSYGPNGKSTPKADRINVWKL